MNKDLTKEEVIQDIKQRILDEHRKYSKLMDDPTIWAEIAARKIYSNYYNLSQINIKGLNLKDAFRAGLLIGKGVEKGNTSLWTDVINLTYNKWVNQFI